MKKIATAVLGATLIWTALSVTDSVYAEEKNMQVKLERKYDNQTTLTFSLSGNYTIKDSNVLLKEGYPYTITYENSKIVLYDNKEKIVEREKEMIFVPEKMNDSHVFKMNDDKYMGEMKIELEKQTIQPVNILPMEDYLKGVVPNEMPSSWHEEALKAQAVSARTYAKGYEGQVINDTVSYQAYGGVIDYNKEKIKKVVEETSGYYLTYKGKLISANYSSSNGGYTESSENIWGGKSDYLIAKEDSFDPKNKWTYEFHYTQIDLTGMDLKNPENWWHLVAEKEEKRSYIAYLKNQILQKEGTHAKEVKIVNIPLVELTKARNENPRSISGTIKLSYLLKDASGQIVKAENGEVKVHTFEKTYPADQLRALFGNNEFKSSLITTSVFDETTGVYKFEGFGYGHGVGMSQYGADARAKAGHSYQDILSFYYPGTTLEKNSPTSEVPETPEPEVPVVEKESYTVKQGDTLYSISRAYGVSLAELKKENNLQSDIIFVGQRLIVPVKTPETPVEKPIENPVEEPVKEKPTRDKLPQKNEINVYVKGKKITMDVKPVNTRGTTVVPVRAIMENLGLEVKWNQQTSTVTILDEKKEIKMKVGDKTAHVNGKAFPLPMAPILEKNRTMVPIRFIAESTGYQVDWEQKTTSIDIY